MESGNMKRLAYAVVALIVMTISANAQPSFIQAAAFFLDGVPNVEVSTVKNGEIGVEMVGRRWLYITSDEEPCTVIKVDLNGEPARNLQEFNSRKPKLLKALIIDFSKLPGPYAVSWNGAGWLMHNLVDGAICESTIREDSSSPLGMSFPNKQCGQWFRSTSMGNGARRMYALRYIRDNFCMGLPEPPNPRPY
jgi:hypothetical protein